MEQKVKKFLEKFVKSNASKSQSMIDLQFEAKDLLEEDFKNSVINLWNYTFKGYNGETNRENYKKFDKMKFIREASYNTEQSAFIMDHWEEVEQILRIIHDYIDLLEKEELKEKKEKKTNE